MGVLIRCIRCNGRKTVFKIGGAYSQAETGGKPIKCPLCMGSGKTKNLKEALNELNALQQKKESIDGTKKRGRKKREEER